MLAGNYTKCEKERTQALRSGGENAKGIYVAQCTGRGEYKRIQCNRGVDRCWCVDEVGKMTEWAGKRRYRRPSCPQLHGNYFKGIALSIQKPAALMQVYTSP